MRSIFGEIGALSISPRAQGFVVAANRLKESRLRGARCSMAGATQRVS
jgi:hypothetical protein